MILIFAASFASAGDTDDVQLSEGENLNFTQLQKDIDTSNDICDLQSDYECEDGFAGSAVNVSRNMKVDGHDNDLNALNKSAIFNVTADEATFTNVNFIDSKNAVVSNSSVLTFQNCRFINSGITFTGGNLTLVNCEFLKDSFIKANASNVSISASKFRSLHVSDNAILINASEVIIDGCTFEDNIAYNLSGDTLYTGGFASLINVTASEVRISNSAIRNSTLKYLIYTLNTTNASIVNVNVTGCDFSASMTRNGIIRDIEGNGTIIGGNYSNLEIKNSRFDDIRASRYSFLFKFDVIGNLTVYNSEFTNLNCPYGVIEVTENGLYGHLNPYTYYLKYNFTSSSIIFDRVLFENITSDYNMTHFDWDDVNGRYIWDYSRGHAHGLDIANAMKNVTLSNVRFDNVNGGFDHYISITSKNLNLTNFTALNSKTGSYMGSWCPNYASFIYADAYGDLTLADIRMDNITVLDFNHTSYNRTMQKYLTTEYYSGDGGPGISIGCEGNVEIHNVNFTNSILPQGGLLALNTYYNVTFERVSAENITPSCEILLDKYYPDLDLQTYKFSTEKYNCYVFSVDGTNVDFRNITMDNVRSIGYYSPISVVAYGGIFMENITCINSNCAASSLMEVSADNGTVRNILIDNITIDQCQNESSYNYGLGCYIWKYSNNVWGSPGISISGGYAQGSFCIYNINITNSYRSSDYAIYLSGYNVTAHDIYINNITKSKALYIKWDNDLGQYLNESYYQYVYEGGISADVDYMNMYNVVLSNLVAEEAEMFYIRGDSATLENITILNFTPGDYERLEYDKNLGMYITTHYLVSGGDVISIDVDEVNITNMYVENLNGFSTDNGPVFTIQSNNAQFINLTAKNMSSFGYSTEYDPNICQYVCSRYDNSGLFMSIYAANITFINSTFSDLTFSTESYSDYVSAIIRCQNYNGDFENVVFEGCSFINCVSPETNVTTYDTSTSQYYSQMANSSYGIMSYDDVINVLINDCNFTNCSSGYGGAIFFRDGSILNSSVISNSRFTNCSAIDGGAVYIVYTGSHWDYLNNLLIFNSTFENNTANNGGAVYISGLDGWIAYYIFNSTFLNSTFKNNSAVMNGGAFYISNLTYNNTISNCNFIENTAGLDGGAIYIFANDMDLNLINSSIFISNHAVHNGGAFYFNNTIDKVMFVDYRWFNETIEDKTVPYEGRNTKILNSRFINNTDYALKIIAEGAKPSQNQTVTIEIAPDATGVVEVNITDAAGNVVNDINGRPITGNHTLTNGSVTFNLGILPTGSYNISARYDNYSYYDTNGYLFHINASVLKVQQSELDVNVTARNVTVFENATFDIEIVSDFRGMVNITVDGETYVRNATAVVEIAKLLSGNKTANVTFWGCIDYEDLTLKVNFTVSKVDLDVGVAIDNVTALDNVTVNVTGVLDNFTGNVSIVVDSVVLYDGPINSIIDLGVLSSGNKSANVTFYGDDKYNNKIIEANFTVSKVDLDVGVVIGNVTALDNVTVKIGGALDNFTGNVTVTVNNVTLYDGPVNSTIDLGVLSSGNKTANVTFYGDDKYNNRTIEANFTVSKVDLDVGVAIGNVTAFDNVTVSIQGNLDNFTGNVSIVVDNVTVYDGPVNSTIDIGILSSGNKTANVTFYGDDKYNNKTIETNFTVSKVDLDVKVVVDDVAALENATINIIDLPQDFKGNVTVVVDNVTVYDGPVNSTIDIGKLSVGDKTSIVTFYGDDRYDIKSVEVSFSVKSAISAEDMTRGWMSPYDYMAKFMDKDLNPLKNAEVTFTINGVKYSARTDGNGVAYLRDSKLPVGKYSVEIENPANGEKATRTITIVARLVENADITMEFVDGTQYRVRAIGDDGMPAGAGEYVYISVNGVTYKRVTDSSGYAYLPINLNPKKYVITAEYKGYKVSNTLVVKQTLKLVKKTIKIKKTSKKIVLKAKLKWASGKPIKGKKIVFKFRGKAYKAKTNKKGIAKVTIKKKVIKKLKKGRKYTFSAKYIKNYVKGKVIVRK